MDKWDVENPDHRRVLQSARAWGISPSRFMGREPVETVSRVEGQEVHTREPEWTSEDRQAAVDLLNWEAATCSGCGHSLAETSSADRQYAYVASLPVRCHYCTAVELAQESYSENPQPSALHFPVTLKEERVGQFTMSTEGS